MMLPVWVYFLAAYGLCFALQNDKVWWLTDRLKAIPFRKQSTWHTYEGVDHEVEEETTFFDRLLACTYCTGFHAGWVTFLAFLVVEGPLVPLSDPRAIPAHAVGLLVWAFCSAVFCYSVDTLTKFFELSTPE